MEKLSLPFPLLADESAAVISAWGVYDERAQIAKPAIFVIGRDLSIPYRYVGRDFADRPPNEELYAALDRVADAAPRPLERAALPRGPRTLKDSGRTPMPLEEIQPYFRGVFFATSALAGRIPQDERLQAEVKRYREMATDFMKECAETIRIVRDEAAS